MVTDVRPLHHGRIDPPHNPDSPMLRSTSPYSVLGSALAAMGSVFAVFFVLNQLRYQAVIVADAVIAAVLLAAACLTFFHRARTAALGGAIGMFMAVALVVEPFSRYRLLHPAVVPIEFALTVLALACGAAAAIAATVAVHERGHNEM